MKIAKKAILTFLVWLVESVLLFLICWGIGVWVGFSNPVAAVIVTFFPVGLVGIVIGLIIQGYDDDWGEYIRLFHTGWLLALPFMAFAVFEPGNIVVTVIFYVVNGGIALFGLRVSMYPVWDLITGLQIRSDKRNWSFE